MPDESDREDAAHEFEVAFVPSEETEEILRQERPGGRLYVMRLQEDSPESPTGFNGHTVGLRDNFGHPDFQLVARMSPGMAAEILINLAEAVVAGRRFAAGDLAGGMNANFVVGFAKATEGEVLRVIVPDKEGRTARGEIDEAFAVQYEGTT
jgi:hypothetical protein